jgi:zinc transport system substrate-binding protein
MSNHGVRFRRLMLASALVMLAPLAGHSAGKLTIYTVNYPLQYFTERIGGDLVDVYFPAPKDIDPAYWSPNVETISAYQQADLIVLNGAGYAKWVRKVALPRLRTVDTSAAFSDRLITAGDVVTHSHGPEGDHLHSGTAFTTWLDFTQAAQQAEAIAVALTRKRPDAKGQIDRNLDSLKADLLALDERTAKAVSSDATRPLLASHPVYQYLARRYGLNLKSVMWEPDEAPGAAQWAQLGETLNDHPARWMLWEREPVPETIERLGQLGVESIVLNPCGNLPKAGDFLSVMVENAASLEHVYE